MKLIATISLFAFSLTVAAQDAPPPRPASMPQLFQDAQTPMPPGPFSSWPADGRDAAIRGVQAGCMFVSLMFLDNYRGPTAAIKSGVGALVHACLFQKMPADWPDRSSVNAKERQEYTDAKLLDANFPDPEMVFKPPSK